MTAEAEGEWESRDEVEGAGQSLQLKAESPDFITTLMKIKTNLHIAPANAGVYGVSQHTVKMSLSQDMSKRAAVHWEQEEYLHANVFLNV